MQECRPKGLLYDEIQNKLLETMQQSQNVLEAMAYNLKRMPRLLMLQGIK